jgi:predicted Fe-Mo cluster-binding NifX family protein
MRIAFTVDEDRGLDSIVSPKFGRAKYFVIVDWDGREVLGVRTIPNPGASASGGAGIKAVQGLVNERVELVVSGGFGPNALAALEELGIGHLELSGVRISDALREVGRRGEAGGTGGAIRPGRRASCLYYPAEPPSCDCWRRL